MNNASKGRCVTITPSDKPKKDIKLYVPLAQRKNHQPDLADSTRRSTFFVVQAFDSQAVQGLERRKSGCSEDMEKTSIDLQPPAQFALIESGRFNDHVIQICSADGAHEHADDGNDPRFAQSFDIILFSKNHYLMR
jgi:hypothetical protein